VDLLSHARGAAFHRVAFVWLMAVGAAHLTFQNWVMMWQLKLPAHVQVTFQAGFRFFPGINNQMRPAATLRMKTSRAVTRFTAGVFGVCSCRFQSRMRGGAEIADDFLVAIGAFIGPDKLRARNSWWSYDRAVAIECSAGEKSQGKKIGATGRPKQSPAMGEKPPK